ncbi:MAG: 2-C-methyl-D-erythritol 4-phosphate cytidylyltransferase [Oscillospiraceae bacterium]|nr:2-C-methyl-D-erythritol 4-phosphate cytidylyltransferase [Oscillospiraceae bacterium]
MRQWTAEPRPGLSVVVPALFEDSAMEESLLYRQINGVPVVAHTLLALDQIPFVTEIIVVIREAELKRMADICKAFEIGRVRKVVCAREAGLSALLVGVYECDRALDYIAIHDPLRPFVTGEILGAALDMASKAGAGAPAVPVKDTIKIVEAGMVRETPDRNALRLLQTPQVVESSLLKAAISRTVETGIAGGDLAAVLETLGITLWLTEGSDENMRVGAVADLPAAGAILAKRIYG